MIEQSGVVEAGGLRYRNMAAVVTTAVGQMVYVPSIGCSQNYYFLILFGQLFFTFNLLLCYLSFRVLKSNSLGIILVIFVIKTDFPALLNMILHVIPVIWFLISTINSIFKAETSLN